MSTDLTTTDCTFALAAIRTEIARLEALQRSLPPRLFVLGQRLKALQDYARALALAPVEAAHGDG